MNQSKLYQGWVSHAWRKEDRDVQIILLQKRFVIILLLICAALFTGWMSAPSRLTVYIPPDIQNGSTVKANSIPDPLIYSFAYEVWQELNYWPKEGETDYKKNIQEYWPYLTPRFKTELLEENEELKASGQLQRVRYTQGLSGSAYDPGNIKRLSNNTWEVDLKMRLTEYKNGQVVKDLEIIYPLRVTRVNLSPRQNPYSLAIDGFVAEPKRLNTYV